MSLSLELIRILINSIILMGCMFELGLAQTKILIYKNEFVLNLRYKIKVYSRGFYLNGLNSLE